MGRKADGTTLYREVWRKTQAEVVAALAELSALTATDTLAAWAARWLDHLSNRPSTQTGVGNSIRNHAVPALGHLRLAAITPSTVERFAKGLLDVGMHPNSVRKILRDVGACLNAAVRDRVLPENPVKLARKPKSVKTPIDPFTPAELAAVIAAASGFRCGGPLALCAGVGCRVGEALGLDVGDYDPASRRLSITRTYDHKHGLRATKSANGVRTIKVPTPAHAVLVAATAGRSAGPMFRATLHGGGGRMSNNNLNGTWKRLLAAANIRYRNLHQMRHSVASHLIAAGVPVADVAKYLGDDVATVVKTYLHPVGTDPSEQLDQMLGGTNRKRQRKA